MTRSEGLVGRRHEDRFIVTKELVDDFARLSGDRNPIHMDDLAARAQGHPRRVAHGVLSLAALSRLIGMEMPGPGALWLRQRIEWPAPVYVGDEVVIRTVVARHSAAVGVIELHVTATKQDGTIVMRGEAEVRMPSRMAQQPERPATDRVALVTGGSRGLGAAVVRVLGARGHRVAVNHRSSQDLADALVRELGEDRARAFVADVADGSQVASLAAAVLERFGRVDVVVHCATPPYPKRAATDLTRADLLPYWRTYVEAAVDLARLLAPGMKERGFGRLIFVGTSAMFGPPTPGWASYLIAKHALQGLVRSLATELGPSGITTNMISPGMMATDLTADVPPRVKEVEAHRSPLRRLATVNDAAELIAFIATDGGGYLNGTNIPLTGGPV